jgi:hypothetical protein
MSAFHAIDPEVISEALPAGRGFTISDLHEMVERAFRTDASSRRGAAT